MSAIPGKTALSDLLGFSKSQVKKWYNTAIPNALSAVATAYGNRNEVKDGAIFTSGTETTTAAQVSMTTANSVLKGYLMAASGALTDQDLLATAGAVGQPIMQDGTTGVGIVTLASDEEVKLSVILVNTDGAGGADESDAGTPLVVAVMAGTDEATAKAATAFLTSEEIYAALAASTGVHDGATGWVHLANIEFNNPSGVPGTTITANRNNHLGV